MLQQSLYMEITMNCFLQNVFVQAIQQLIMLTLHQISLLMMPGLLSKFALLRWAHTFSISLQIPLHLWGWPRNIEQWTRWWFLYIYKFYWQSNRKKLFLKNHRIMKYLLCRVEDNNFLNLKNPKLINSVNWFSHRIENKGGCSPLNL